MRLMADAWLDSYSRDCKRGALCGELLTAEAANHAILQLSEKLVQCVTVADVMPVDQHDGTRALVVSYACHKRAI